MGKSIAAIAINRADEPMRPNLFLRGVIFGDEFRLFPRNVVRRRMLSLSSFSTLKTADGDFTPIILAPREDSGDGANPLAVWIAHPARDKSLKYFICCGSGGVVVGVLDER
jgi:hypothetical protein